MKCVPPAYNYDDDDDTVEPIQSVPSGFIRHAPDRDSSNPGYTFSNSHAFAGPFQDEHYRSLSDTSSHEVFDSRASLANEYRYEPLSEDFMRMSPSQYQAQSTQQYSAVLPVMPTEDEGSRNSDSNTEAEISNALGELKISQVAVGKNSLGTESVFAGLTLPM